ncbi:class I SAM-dependent methyltransferase [Allosphingosinicella indica]|uniref:SAM-dependent methyltransferase, MidA family n=1 Tax=Allosphingosinicella indica TaxID=941907 RepID=A0A1X7G8M7_9SPHN|nr:SAM-dependent methyltransferase [Allosphingosinicella indica]SMF65406.1 SAM-dependent methyltransferase, MidA family [Allosphingosinicella indica]
MPDANPVPDRLRRLIETSGPITVAQYMAEANAHYYGSRDPLGAAGDFTTAPEISQMFGEMIGLSLADAARRAGADKAAYVELGPGRGTLAADALRVMQRGGLSPDVHFIETSAALRQAQQQRVPMAVWHDDAASLPDNAPLLVVANEFFDALPVHQIVADEGGWREARVDVADGGFRRVAGRPVPGDIPAAPAGTIRETSPASVAVMQEIAGRIARQGGIALVVDYGHIASAVGDTLQAVSRHAYADPWVDPGARDLTAHVDFEALGDAARGAGARVLGPRTQGEWLLALGIDVRATQLAKSHPARNDEMNAALRRLVHADEMGSLFKAMAVVAPDWPDPAGFA